MPFSFVTPVSAATLGDALGNVNKAGTAAGTTGVADLGVFTGTIISLALSLVGLLFLAFTFYAGYLWMTARGEESQIEKAQKIITNTIIGLIITVGAYAITVLVTSRFSSSAPGTPVPEGEPLGCCVQTGPPPTPLNGMTENACNSFTAAGVPSTWAPGECSAP